MKNELKKEKEKFEALFEHAGMGIILADDKGIINLVNHFILNQFGYEHKSDLEGKSVEVLIPKKYTPNHKGYREKYMAQPSPRVMGHGRDLFGMRKDGTEFRVEVSLSNFNAADELSRALNIEKDLGDLKSRFVAMASHEFRTPLSTILSSASLLAKYTHTNEQDKRDKHIDRIKNSVHNLSGILSDFLSMGKIDNGKIELRNNKINIPEFVENICHEMEHY